MAAPPISERHLHHFHRRSPIKESVRMASTGNLTLSGLQTIDGVVGVADDRVLVKDNSTGSQNGIWLQASGVWTRAYDVSTDDPAFGFLVYVREGTTNGGRTYRNTNTSAPTIDTTSLTFAQLTAAAGSTALDDLSDVVITSATAADRLRFNGTAWVNSALVWRPAMVLDPTSGNFLPMTTGDGDAVMTEA